MNEVVEVDTAQELKQTNFPVSTGDTSHYYSASVQTINQQDIFLTISIGRTTTY